MSAAARAEARRKAILSRGTDRLAKLSTSARGEDNPVYVNHDSTSSTLKTDAFLGEGSIMPTPPARADPAPPVFPHAQATNANGTPGWTPEQQQDFIRALMSTNALGTVPPGQGNALPPLDDNMANPLLSNEDPMAAMMNALTQLTGQTPATAAGHPSPLSQQQEIATRPKTVFEKLLPLIHLIATWALLAFYVLYKEPEAFEKTAHSMDGMSRWQRWADLSRVGAKSGFGVQSISFFWSFVTLQLVLHSIQIFTKSNPVQPPMLLALALPYLPPTISFVITNALSYVRMLGSILDDLAGLLVGVGLLIFFTNWLSGW